MENHRHFLLKVSRLFPSSLTSCQFRAIPDVAESSITIPKTKSVENDPSSPHPPPYNFLEKPSQHEKPFLFPKKKYDSCKRSHLSAAVSDTDGRKCPPVTPISVALTDQKKMMSQRTKGRNFQENDKKKSRSTTVLQSSSSNSGWFSSSDERYSRADSGETDAFFSLSSNSGDSFRLKTSRRFRRCEEMKSIDEMGRCSFSSSVASFDTFLSQCSSRKKAGRNREEKKPPVKSWPEYELGSDQISTQIYYSNEKPVDSLASSRRRKNARTCRKTANERSSGRKSLKNPVIGESHAVEKSSSDPHGDFRASMVEMIVAKRMFGAEDLERLLRCFLSLNEVSYHGIIFEVFSEICETLFGN